MQVKRIMMCLDGSKHSLKGLETAIAFAKQTNAVILGIHIDTTHGLFTAVHTPKMKQEKWTNTMKGTIKTARNKVEKSGILFEGIVIAGRNTGIDLATFANNPHNKIDYIVIGASGLNLPNEIFLGSTSNFVMHKAKPPVTIVK
jgi:nucleotide-binding universal stress UspA family protein